jgi:LPXTG-site transpeptidase (sortase) family protein
MSSRNKKQNPVITLLLVTLGLGLVCAGSFFLYSALTTKKVIIQAPSSVAKASIKKKTTQEKNAYTVPADHPRELTIKKLGVDANIVAVGAPSGTLGAPGSAWDAGWYDKSALPGSGSGALLIDGHVNDALGSPGIFYSLTDLVKGDEISIERGDGKKFTYSVAKVQDISLQDVDMSDLAASIQSGKEGLNLITCGGTYDYQKKTYDHRVLVFAVRK